MQGLVYAAVGTLSAAVVIMILIVFIWRYCCHRKVTVITEKTKVESVRSGIGKLPMTNESQDRDSFAGFHHQDTQNRVSYSVFRRGIPPNASFNWADHPWLVSEAVEYGWSRFGFTAETPSPSTRSNLLGLCSAADQGRDTTVDINWEVCAESVDFMQKIRFNPELKKIDMGTAPSCASSSCVIVKSSLPLPGPPLENSSFPQEAYFEITIKSCPNDEVESVISAKRSPGSGELTKLIPQKSNVSVQSDSLIHFKEINGSGRTQELKLRINEEGGQKEMTVFSVGFSVGGSLPRKIPGSYAGSIGFNSNGSLFLDGMKLVSEAEKTEWDSRDKVIGCGFDPSQKKVFFTVDSELVHVINCKSDEFSFPLYPTLAANVDITVSVNFGQSAFKYLPANAQRTPNPCFIAPPEKGSASGYEDSRDLFSMAILDPQWHNPYTSKNDYKGENMSPDRKWGTNMSPDRKGETELFEIAVAGPVDQKAKR